MSKHTLKGETGETVEVDIDDGIPDQDDEDEGAPLWGKEGPAKGQTVVVAGIGMRWTGLWWERVR